MGFSTSLVVQEMKKAAKAQGKDHKIWATDANSVDEENERIDVVLIGPQVSYKLNDVKRLLDNPGIPVAVMDKLDYGSCNGAAILKFAEELASRI
jgi:PTS system cellobiose-specific IIB component